MINTSIVQWNAQGLRNKKNELLELIKEHNASIVAIQETKLSSNYNIRLPSYNVISKDGHYNRGNHGGVALYIHSDVPYNEIPLNTSIQAVAAEVRLNFNFTICNIYSSRSHQLSTSLLCDLIQQLPKPFLIVGDFNAYSTMWSCSSADTRGRAIEDCILRNNLVILNDSNPTRIGYNSETIIDLSLCSPAISLNFDWSVLSTPLDSDHCPIIIKLPDADPPPPTTSWNIKNANWDIFTNCPAWDNLPPVEGDNDYLLDDFYGRLMQASAEGIPQFTPCKFYPKPWWTDELKASKQKREYFYRKYRQVQTNENLVRWKHARAQHKYAVNREKKRSFRESMSEMHYGEPLSKLYRTMRKLKGNNPRAIYTYWRITVRNFRALYKLLTN